MTQEQHIILSSPLPPNIQRGNDIKYIVDPSLPGVAKHFRLLGIDCAYENNYTDAYILHLARAEDRFIITRSSKLVNRLHIEAQRSVTRQRKLNKFRSELEQYQQSHAQEEWDEDTIDFLQEQIEILEEETTEEYTFRHYWVNALGRKKQLREVVKSLKIEYIQENMFTRCSKCNGINRSVSDKSVVKGKVHDNVYEENDQFAMCDRCEWVTWGTIEQNAKFPSQINIYLNAVRFCKEYSYHPDTQTVGLSEPDIMNIKNLNSDLLCNASGEDQEHTQETINNRIEEYCQRAS